MVFPAFSAGDGRLGGGGDLLWPMGETGRADFVELARRSLSSESSTVMENTYHCQSAPTFRPEIHQNLLPP